MWQRILVATDGSEMAQRAETVGIETAERFGAHLVFVHVVAEDGPRDNEYDGLAQALGAIGPLQVGSVHQENLVQSVVQATGAEGVETHRDALRAFGDCVLNRAAERARAGGIEAETRLGNGKPAATVCDIANQEEADLIVVGTRGLAGLRGVLMGSASRRIVEEAEQNCLVVKH